MSGLTGKGSTSIKKQEVAQSRLPAVAFRKVRALHQCSADQTIINITSLTTPDDVVNYSAPNPSLMATINMFELQDNVEITSSIRGKLMQNLAYVVTGASTIELLFEAEDGEALEIIIDHVARTGATLVDARPIVVTGTLLATQTDFNVGEPFKVGEFPLAQHGAVMVMVDNQIMYRNTGNQAPGLGVEGDYYEVHAGGGLGTIIRFNMPDLTNDRTVSVVSIGALVERPASSQMALVEAVQGQIDAMVPTLASLAGVDESDFQATPNNVDLKAFGDRVIALEKILDLQIPIKTAPQNFPSVAAGTLITGFVSNPTYGNIGNNVATWYRDGSDAIITWNFHTTSAGTVGSGIYFFNIPPVIGVIDDTKVKFNTQTNAATFHDFDSGLGFIQQGSTSGYIHIGQAVAYDATRIKFHYLYAGASQGASIFNSTNAAFGGTECTITLTMRVPIKGWLPTQSVREALGL